MAASPFDQLSAGLLQRVLQGVPQTERLTQSACVCRAWAELAALATTDVDCKLSNSSQTEAFEGWLRKHAGQLRSLVVCGSYGSNITLQLPWVLLSKLHALKLNELELPAIQSEPDSSSGGSNASASTGTAALLPQLRQLELYSCTLYSGSCLLQLASSSQLTRLDLNGLQFRSLGGGWLLGNAAAQQQVSRDVEALLQRHQLAELELFRVPVSTAALQQVFAMQQLRKMAVTLSTDSAGGMAHLPSTLTWLSLTDRRETSPQLTITPQLQQLTSLQHAELFDCALQPSALASMPLLQDLQLGGCTLLPNRKQGAVALLRSLQQLTLIKNLHLDGVSLHAPRLALQLFSALTASPQLTSLFVQSGNVQPLPRGAVEHLAPAGRQLPLQTLEIAFDYFDEEDEQQGWCIDSDDLDNIISGCPRLTWLRLEGVVRSGADVSALTALPESCHGLVIGGDGLGDASAGVVAQLSQLTRLVWTHSPQLSDLGLQSLTAVRGLRELCLMACSGISTEVRQALDDPDDPSSDDEQEPTRMFLELNDSTEEGPVWRQLKRLCDQSPLCLWERSQRQNAGPAGQMAEHARLQQQVQDLQQQLADRDAQVEQLQAELLILRGLVYE